MGGPSYEVMVLGSALSADPTAVRSVIDIGCGDGRNAFLLAGVGARVVALDRDANDLAYLSYLAQKWSRPIETVHLDAREYNFALPYDIFLSHGLLHFMNLDDVKLLVDDCKRYTRAGGYHIYTVSTFATTSDIISDFRKQGHLNSISASDLCAFFADWELVLRDDYVKWDAHPGGVRHVHPISKLIFRKNGGSRLVVTQRIPLSWSPAEKEAQDWATSADRIGSSEGLLRSAIGEPELEYVAFAPGVQFGFGLIEPTGYKLNLAFYGRIMFYIANGKVSGFSRHHAHFTAMRPA